MTVAPPPGTLTEDAEPVLPALVPTPRGRYRHYKGGEYEVIDTVRHSETLERMTLYQALYEARGLWVRPADMYEGDVLIDGTLQKRFTLIS